jgi:hypothetical protein
MTEAEFTTNMQAQRLRNEIKDIESDIASFVEGLRISRAQQANIKRDLHAIEHPGEEFKDDDLL